MLRDARQAATLIAAVWRGHLGRRAAHQQRRDRAATRIAARWRGHRQRKVFLAHRVSPAISQTPTIVDWAASERCPREASYMAVFGSVARCLAPLVCASVLMGTHTW